MAWRTHREARALVAWVGRVQLQAAADAVLTRLGGQPRIVYRQQAGAPDSWNVRARMVPIGVHTLGANAECTHENMSGAKAGGLQVAVSLACHQRAADRVERLDVKGIVSARRAMLTDLAALESCTNGLVHDGKPDLIYSSKGGQDHSFFVCRAASSVRTSFARTNICTRWSPLDGGMVESKVRAESSFATCRAGGGAGMASGSSSK